MSFLPDSARSYHDFLRFLFLLFFSYLSLLRHFVLLAALFSPHCPAFSYFLVWYSDSCIHIWLILEWGFSIDEQCAGNICCSLCEQCGTESLLKKLCLQVIKLLISTDKGKSCSTVLCSNFCFPYATKRSQFVAFCLLFLSMSIPAFLIFSFHLHQTSIPCKVFFGAIF